MKMTAAVGSQEEAARSRWRRIRLSKFRRFQVQNQQQIFRESCRRLRRAEISSTLRQLRLIA